MRFIASKLPGAFLIEPELNMDQRGFFARSWCAREFAERGLETRLVQCNISYNERRGTLRGLHYQEPPHAEVKLVRCTRGRVFDVIVDLRRDSPTYCRWQAYELSAENHRGVYIPPGIAHGYQTVSDGSEVCYQMSEYYDPEAARGVRWDDPAFSIAWPLPVTVISPKDAFYGLIETTHRTQAA